MADGYLNICKICHNLRYKQDRIKNPEKYKKFEQNRLHDPDRVLCRKRSYERRKKSQKYKDQHNKSNRKYYYENPLKTKARMKFAYEFRNGNIKKKPCNVCGDKETEAHHEDYNYPLDVIWLCDKHHKEIHVKKRRKES